MDLGIAGKVAFVSGGTKGIGRAAAEMFAQEGCRVVVTGRSQDGVEETVTAIKRAGGSIAGIAVDMTTKEGVERSVEFARKTFGPPDIAVSNVHLGHGGGAGEGSFDAVTDERFTGALNDLLMSVVWLTRAVIPHMKERRWGRLVNIGSGSAKEPPMKMAHLLHNVARAPVVTLNKTLATELGPYGITVNTVATGWITTPAQKVFAAEMNIDHDRMFDYVKTVHLIPMNRFGRAEEEAALIVFLASELAGFITGTLIPVDGGAHESAW